MKATILSAVAAILAALSLAVSLHSLHVARHTERAAVPPSEHVGAAWTSADEQAVAVLMTKTGQQLGGYLASLKRGTSRHGYTEAQLEEALRRRRSAADWQAATNAAAVVKERLVGR